MPNLESILSAKQGDKLWQSRLFSIKGACAEQSRDSRGACPERMVSDPERGAQRRPLEQ